MRIPLFAVIEVESATTNGIAKPRACGQAITSTVTVLSRAKSGPTKENHTRYVIMPLS